MNVIMVHGSVETSEEPNFIEALQKAALAGNDFLPENPLDAAETAVKILEDHPDFNAGFGSVLNLNGDVELDAAIMDGILNKFGAVCAVKGVKNPVSLARMVMEETPHVILAGDGAIYFAREKGLQPVNMISPRQKDSYIQAMEMRKKGYSKDFSAFTGLPKGHDTVGCVVLSNGCLVAASSTGGSFLKLPGRVGDTPIIGAGIYASKHCAVVCTGLGESFIECLLAKWAEDMVKKGLLPQDAARQAIIKLGEEKGSPGGILVVDNDGRVGAAHNTASFPVGLVINGQIIKDFKPEQLELYNKPLEYSYLKML